ncbi:MAG: DUF4157 domain-containing protein [Deltaproteobacteria bacterium]|jgi:hypothetical protein|nr:DUF4157 domain-containing protein [Deltaproteobacteria bacterium]
MNSRAKLTTKIHDVKRKQTSSNRRKSDISQSINSPIDNILFLQTTIGNQAVQRLFKSGVIQAKLKIGQPNDIYEQEADRVAEQVMRMPEPKVQRQIEPEEEEEETLQAKPLAEQITPFVQRQVEPEEEEEEEPIQAKLADGAQLQRQEEEPEEEEEPIQTKQVSTRAPAGTPNLASRIQSLEGGGQPLPKSERAFFEPRFGYDFSQVQVHTDTEAHMLNCALNARAFTIGQDIFVHQRDYNSGSSHGRELLAHELTHVVQQNFPGNETRVQLKEDKTSEPAITDVSDDTVYKVSDPRAIIRTAPPALKSKGTKISWDSQVKITQRYAKDGESYVYVKKAYGDKSDLGWTLEDNLDVSDVPSKDRYGCLEATFHFIKNDKYLQPQTIYALAQIDNPIEITKGEVTDLYHLRLTECMYPSSFTHTSKGHYTGHCVDIAFTGAYGGKAKKEIEKQGKKAFVTIYKGTIYKHGNHLHGCVAYPSWVSSRTTTRLKELLRERKDEY